MVISSSKNNCNLYIYREETSHFYFSVFIMGAYLSEPVTKTESYDDSKGELSYGTSGMQGWRVSMEDAHSCILDYDDELSLFAVYDGHGGSEVATYTAENLPNFLKTIDEYKEGNLKDCLINGFLGFDQNLLKDEVMTKLRELAGMSNTEAEDNELDSLTQDAEMPLDQLMSKLKEGGYHISTTDEDDDDEDESEEDDEDEESLKENSNEDKIQSNGEGSKNGKDVSEDEKENQNTDTVEEKKSEKNVDGIESDDKKDQNKTKDKERKVEEEDEKKEDVVNKTEEQEEEDEIEEDDDDDDEDDEDDEEDDDEEEGQTHWGDGDEVGYDSGTTAVVALLKKDRLVVGNVGDSRCVLCRSGVAIDMSVDHKPENDKELTRIRNAGGRVTGEGRVNGGLNLSRAIGDHRYKGKSDLGADEQQITAMPDVIETEITEADQFVVLACDGIWNVLSSQEVIDFVSERLRKQTDKESLSKICEELFGKCLASDTSGDGTGCDNMTAVIVLLPGYENCAQQTKRKLNQENDKDNADCSTKKARTE